MPRDVFVTTRMRPDLARAVRVAAARLDKSRSEAIRQAVEDWLERQPHAERQPAHGDQRQVVRDAQ